MHPIRVLAAATAMEIAAVGAVLSIAGLAGIRSGWLDVINSFAPVILGLALIGSGLAFFSLEGQVRTITIGLSLIAIAYGLALIIPEYVRWPPRRSVDGAQFRVLSANVWSDNPTPGLAVDAILARDANAVLLQEMDGSLQSDLGRLKTLYPYASDCPGAGLQIFVKSPIIAQGCKPRPGAASGLNLIWVQTTASDGRPVILVTTHFGWPFPPGTQLAQRNALAARVHELPAADLLLGGDFNTTPWSSAMKRQDKSLLPLTRQTLGWFTWPARLDALRQPWATPILPIDHLYSGMNWRTAKLTRLRIPGSDHFATEAAFVRQP